MATKKLLTTNEAAAYINMSVSFLEKDRMSGKANVPFVRIGVRMIRYRPEDLDEWLRTRPQGYAEQRNSEQDKDTAPPPRAG